MLCQNANLISFHFYENELFIRKCCFTESVKIDFNEIEKIKTLDDLINKVTYKKLIEVYYIVKTNVFLRM